MRSKARCVTLVLLCLCAFSVSLRLSIHHFLSFTPFYMQILFSCMLILVVNQVLFSQAAKTTWCVVFWWMWCLINVCHNSPNAVSFCLFWKCQLISQTFHLSCEKFPQVGCWKGPYSTLAAKFYLCVFTYPRLSTENRRKTTASFLNLKNIIL